MRSSEINKILPFEKVNSQISIRDAKSMRKLVSRKFFLAKLICLSTPNRCIRGFLELIPWCRVSTSHFRKQTDF